MNCLNMKNVTTNSKTTVPNKTKGFRVSSTSEYSGIADTSLFSYSEAKEFIHLKMFQSVSQYSKWRKTDEGKASRLPYRPESFYRNEDFSWDDFLGMAYVNYKETQSQKIEYTYEEASAFARRLKFTSVEQWMEWIKLDLTPKDFPKLPDRYFKRRGTWQGWTDFLNTLKHKEYENAVELLKTNNTDLSEKQIEESKSTVVFNQNEAFAIPFPTFRDNVRRMMFESSEQYENWCRTNNMSLKGYPTNPDYFYSQRKVWTNWPDVLGKYDPLSTMYSDKCEYIEAKRFAQSLNFKTETEWRAFWIKHPNHRTDIPRYPDSYYKLYWESWAHFLGTQISYRLSEDLYNGAVLFVASTSATAQNVFEVAINREGPHGLLNYVFLNKEGWKLIKCYKFTDEVVNNQHKNSESFVKHLISQYDAGSHWSYEGIVISNIWGLLSDLDYYFEPLDIKSIKIQQYEHPHIKEVKPLDNSFNNNAMDSL